MSEATEIRAAVQANTDFYHAFALGDFPAMNALWAEESPVLCIHPGIPALHGRDAVMESWETLLDSPPAIRHSSAQVAVVRGVAFVTCLEHIGEEITLAATNAFAWESGAWRLVLHQAGALDPMDPEVPSPGGHLH